jgi:tetratricopeptide (TPR) repeat protein
VYLRRSARTWQTVLDLFLRAGEGLAAAHRAGIVHRDFKPDNVLVALDGDTVQRVVVTDFGVARSIVMPRRDSGPALDAPTRDDPNLTAPGAAIGTPAYMAPEQLAGEEVDARADVFAFAAATWEGLYGRRAFAGRTVGEIRAALDAGPPHPPDRSAVPSWISRALVRALARDPAARWPTLDALLAALDPRRRRQTTRRAIAIAGGLALCAGGVVVGRAFAGPEGPRCERDDATWTPARSVAFRSALAADPSRATVLAALVDARMHAWHETSAATCRADREPAQPLPIASCLDARRLELTGFVDDVLGGVPALHAERLAETIGDPAACAQPTPSLLEARVPADPMLRRLVTVVRLRAIDGELARERGDLPAALAAANAADGVASSLWPPLHAETLYLRGATELKGGAPDRARAILRDAAALAERTRHDAIAVQAWLQLALAATDDNDTKRALEYTDYAEAALDRIARPPELETLFRYTHGVALAQAHDSAGAERELRRAAELATTAAPRYAALATQGLAYFYNQEGRQADSVAAYRDALARSGALPPIDEVIERDQLAMQLAGLGKVADARAEAERALAVADRALAPTQVERSSAHAALAQVDELAGELPAALDEVRAAEAFVERADERSGRFGELLWLEGSILIDMRRFDEADAKMARACDVTAFSTGDDSLRVASCLTDRAISLSARGRYGDALALFDRARPIVLRTVGEGHPVASTLLLERGKALLALGRRAEARGELEKARGALAELPGGVDQLADAELALARALWPDDRARSSALADDAIARLEAPGVEHHDRLDAAKAWRSAHR